ncbi:MAG: hypothetical protein KGH93_01495 [Patescibacteria group bacterium]|nr:hypothetical protein [Patescibacteria group bacterium]MDE1945855.1 hypothetical protein [Patescibacteria group bacterium]
MNPFLIAATSFVFGCIVMYLLKPERELPDQLIVDQASRWIKHLIAQRECDPLHKVLLVEELTALEYGQIVFGFFGARKKGIQYKQVEKYASEYRKYSLGNRITKRLQTSKTDPG